MRGGYKLYKPVKIKSHEAVDYDNRRSTIRLRAESVRKSEKHRGISPAKKLLTDDYH